MGNLIFLIVIIFFVRNIIGQKKKTDGKEKPSQTDAERRAGTFQGTFGTQKENRRAASYGRSSVSEKRSYSGKTSAPDSTATKRTQAAASAQAKSEERQEDISTTEYLRQKALEDQQEHAEQSRMEAMRLHRETGGRRVAWHHYDGDSIPKDMRLIKCGYCGAENLIGNGEKQSNFTCYFCREIL